MCYYGGLSLVQCKLRNRSVHTDEIRCLHLFAPPSEGVTYQSPSSSASLFSLRAVQHHFYIGWGGKHRFGGAFYFLMMEVLSWMLILVLTVMKGNPRFIVIVFILFGLTFCVFTFLEFHSHL